MNHTPKLDTQALKSDESAFRKLVGNIPGGFGVKFQPHGLVGDSWTFFKSDDGAYLLQRKSTGEVLDIIGYAKAVGLSIKDLKDRFPEYLGGLFYE